VHCFQFGRRLVGKNLIGTEAPVLRATTEYAGTGSYSGGGL
jgi:hypothetical protein